MTVTFVTERQFVDDFIGVVLKSTQTRGRIIAQILLGVDTR